MQLAIVPGSAEFDVSPTNWASAEWATGGTATVAAGVLLVDGARANTALGLNYDPGTAIEFVATFGAATFQAIGLGTGATDPDLFNSVPLAIFTTNISGSEVIARVSPPTGPSLDPLVAPGLIGTSHTYKIVWQTTGFQFYVDNGR